MDGGRVEGGPALPGAEVKDRRVVRVGDGAQPPMDGHGPKTVGPSRIPLLN